MFQSFKKKTKNYANCTHSHFQGRIQGQCFLKHLRTKRAAYSRRSSMRFQSSLRHKNCISKPAPISSLLQDLPLTFVVELPGHINCRVGLGVSGFELQFKKRQVCLITLVSSFSEVFNGCCLQNNFLFFKYTSFHVCQVL